MLATTEHSCVLADGSQAGQIGTWLYPNLNSQGKDGLVSSQACDKEKCAATDSCCKIMLIDSCIYQQNI